MYFRKGHTRSHYEHHTIHDSPIQRTVGIRSYQTSVCTWEMKYIVLRIMLN